MKTRIRWAIGGGIAAIIAALFIGLSGGMGSGTGTPSPEASTAKEPEGEVAKPSPYFTIHVDGSVIRVEDRALTADEAAAAAKKDGRPVEIRWKGAYTDAEDAIKKAFRAAEVPIQRETQIP